MKLTYFAVRGRIEPARLCLALRGVPYDFEGVPHETWRGPEGKARIAQRTPFGQLPLLEDGETTVCQSGAIHRYLARKLGLHGESIEQQARVDEVFETGLETWVEASTANWTPHFHDKRAELRAAAKARLDRLALYFERVRADDEHWVLPGRYTMADAMMAYALECSLPQHPGLLAEYPALHHATTRFFEAPGVRDYVRGERRPRTLTVPQAPFGGKPEEAHHWGE